MSLRYAYTLWAPFYDALLTRVSAPSRIRNLAHLTAQPAARVLLNGVGTGLDLPHLPRHHHYTALDLTPAMLRRARARTQGLGIDFVEGDSHTLPFATASFDHVILHLILAVVPNPAKAFSEAVRVLKPGGEILILDKFLHPGQYAPIRRILNPLSRRLATRLDVEFEPLIAAHPKLIVCENQPALLGGWIRRIRLRCSL